MKEIFNFTQDDLTTEDVLILDCYREIYVWCGSHSNVRSKKQALEIGLVITIILNFSFFNSKIYILDKRFFAFMNTDKYSHVYCVRPKDALSTPMFDLVYFKDEPFHKYALNSALQLIQIVCKHFNGLFHIHLASKLLSFEIVIMSQHLASTKSHIQIFFNALCSIWIL